MDEARAHAGTRDIELASTICAQQAAFPLAEKTAGLFHQLSRLWDFRFAILFFGDTGKGDTAMESILEGLNEQQKAAAQATEGYVRVIAGAGSGKTKTLTARFLYLVETLGISTADILCVTFTNKAAAEMKKRIRQALPDEDLAQITTFHGFCVGLLKEDCHVLQYPSSFIVLDEEDKASMLRGIFEELNITTREMTVQDAAEYIGWRKGGCGYVKTLIDMYKNNKSQVVSWLALTCLPTMMTLTASRWHRFCICRIRPLTLPTALKRTTGKIRPRTS